MGLKQELDAFKAQFVQTAPAGRFALYTAKIEELIDELSADYTIVIVTHNMQQASRASDYTAFMYLGELVEYGATEKIFTAPDNKRTEQYITGRFG